MKFILSLPNTLTIIRLLFIPFLMPLLIFFNIVTINESNNLLCAIIYFLISLTDFFDGYFARKFNQVSKIGALLDPLADKLTFVSMLILLVSFGYISFFWVIILINRELFVTGLRLIGAEFGFTIAVHWSGKVKTILQDILIIFIILTMHLKQESILLAERILLLAVIFFALGSALQYYKFFIKKWGEAVD